MTISGINPLAPSGDDGKNFKKPQTGPLSNQTDRIEVNKAIAGGGGEAPIGEKAAESMSDISYRIELAKSRISRNHNEKATVDSNREIVDKFKLIKSLGLRSGIQNSDTSNDRGAKIGEIRQRILDGHYDDPIHMAELADILIREFDLE